MVTLRIQREDMVSSSECVRNFSRMLDRVKEKPLFIVRNNDIEGIMMDIEEYEMLMERMEYLEEKAEESFVGLEKTKRKQREDLKEREKEESFVTLHHEEEIES